MSVNYITYEKINGYKYRLAEDYKFFMPELMNYRIDTLYIKVLPMGLCYLLRGYACDGASGPTIDTPNSMRGAFEHDALYQLIRLGLLPESFRETADKRLEKTCIEDGMGWLRAVVWGRCVRWFARYAILPKRDECKIYCAPKELT